MRRSLAVRARLHLIYAWRHRRRLSLGAPRLFTELVQHRKLFDRDPRLPAMIDKLAVKALVAERLGVAWVTPTLWSGDVLPADPPTSAPFVVKARHGCRQVRIVRDAADWAAARRGAMRWMRRRYGGWLDEWGYRDVPRGLLIEPFIGSGAALPVDYKLYVFHGRVEAVQVHRERATDHHWALYDRDWRRLSAAPPRGEAMPPATLARMIEGAEAIGAAFDFVRIDVYEIGGVPRFGEATFYPGSGLDPFDPPALDRLLGGYWRQSGTSSLSASAAPAR